MKLKLLSILAIAACTLACQQPQKAGFAVVIDPQSYEEAKTEIDQYLQVVENRGLKAILVIDQWGVPDSIRAKLIELYNAKENPIEGAVFIGDIPVAMVQDAQFMTSAFKMDQDSVHYDRLDYCVPTDRYYDTFGFEWDYLGQDSTRWFYYSLNCEGAQELHPNIYSARITPRDNERGNKYEKLRRYMQRVNAADSENNQLDQMLCFAGHGNVSDSYAARMDEKIEYYDQFPWMKDQKQSVRYMDFSRDDFIKARYMTEMQDPSLDYGLCHHHGSETVQYFSSTPNKSSYSEQIQYIQHYMRNRIRTGIRRGQTPAEVIASIRKYAEVDIPDSWFARYNDPAIIAQDDSIAYLYDLHVEEFADFRPQCKLVSLDACYNGSFHLDESIQEGYLFGEGNGTLLVLANSVNALQDKWCNEYSGLLGLGMRAGYMAIMDTYLEFHLFGDPTYAFAQSGDCGFDVNDAILHASDNFWVKQLDNEYPAVQLLAIHQLNESEQNYSDVIYQRFKTSPYGMVRTAAMYGLRKYSDENLLNCLKEAIFDENEMTQRFAVNLCSDYGEPSLLEQLCELRAQNNVSERVSFDLDCAFKCFDSTLVMETIKKYFDQAVWYSDKEAAMAKAVEAFDYYISGHEDIEYALHNKDARMSRRVMEIKGLRNYPEHQYLDELLEYALSPEGETEILYNLWEALGWFDLSYRKSDVATAAKQVAEDERFDESIRKQAMRTYIRTK